MTTPVSGGSRPPLTVTRSTERTAPAVTPQGHVQAGVTGSARAERTYAQERMGVDRFDPGTNARLPGQGRAAAAAIPTLTTGRQQVGGSVAALSAEGVLRNDDGSVARRLEGRALVAEGGAHGTATVGGQGVQASGEVRASAMLAEGRVRTAEGREVGSVTVGASASMAGTLNINPSTGDYRAGVTVDNFAGVRAEGQARFGTEDASVTGRLAVQAGVGLTARMEAGLQNNRLRGRLEFGAALGLGVRAGVSVDVNLQSAVRVAQGAAELAGSAARTATNWAGRQITTAQELLRNTRQPLSAQ
ncbi:hypothetical protein [Corallococcus silvisoli]|uniref:hypothetical protein n=1 Tax=Corallococcus silvisoli TaxID=2697031 RepID=UPI001377E66F|nr:hypothetical protein [Corallococcus silvisoli]NBD14407.1 hypothetical protein [Corallococcus silvisoli]